MGEIDTKPIDSVQTAISFFGQTSTFPSNNQQVQQEVEKNNKRGNEVVVVEGVMKELANVRVQMEAKESAYKQALLSLQHHQKTAHDLTILLKKSDSRKESYVNQCQDAKARINELESAMNLQLAHHLSETEKLQDQLLHARNDLLSAQARVIEMETELAVLREAVSQAKAMENDLSKEKLKKEELLRRVSEMNETIEDLKTEAVEAEREKTKILLEKEAEIEIAAKALAEAEEHLEVGRKQLEIMQHDMEKQLLDKSAYIDSLQLELKQANELQLASEKIAKDAVSEVNQLKENAELEEKKKLDQAAYASLLETELKQLRTEVENTKEQAENMRLELEKSREKENDAQVEIALLKFELHKGRSKLAAAEAAEARAQTEKSALYNALQQMGLEAEEAKKEKLRALKELADATKGNLIEEEAILIRKRSSEHEKADEQYEKANDLDHHQKIMKKELEAAMSKMGELRTRAEQAISRAEAAEKAKAALEEGVKKRKEQKERRKAALDALLQESNTSINYNGTTSSRPTNNYQPLAKVLNMKF